MRKEMAELIFQPTLLGTTFVSAKNARSIYKSPYGILLHYHVN
jgi:hypothetical protein